MAGTVSGGKRAVETQVNRIMVEQGVSYEEAYKIVKERFRAMGASGGKKGRTGGFAYGEIGRERARIAGAIGGSVPKRKPAK